MSTTVRVSGLGGLALRLTRARFSAQQGETLLYFASVAAYTICGVLALAVASGTHMFYQRWQQPRGIHAELVVTEPLGELLLFFYFMLAVIACALLVPSLASLSANAAVLGARARERRLAVLRLLGLSSGEVTRMSLADTAIQATLGSLLGAGLYLATVPGWQALELMAMPLTVAEMLPPWWLALGVITTVILVGLLSAWWGLRRVRISPLGVSRLSSRPGLKWWRLAAFVAIFAVALVGMQFLQAGSVNTAYLLLAAILMLSLWGINLVGPYLLQLLARPAVLGRPALLWAARRVMANPKTTWRRVAGLGLLSFIAGYVSLMPIALNTQNKNVSEFVLASQWDLTKGVLLTLAIGLLLTATSIMISQASAVYERASQSIAMHKMGAPTALLTAASWLETLVPLALALVLGFSGGMVLSLPMMSYTSKLGLTSDFSGVVAVTLTLAIGVGLSMLALVLCQPLQRRILAEQRRATD